MSKTGEEGKVPLPPLDKDGNPIVGEDDANTKTFMAPTLEELMRRLEELTTENKKLRAKAKNKKTKGNSSSSEEEDSSFEEDVSKKEKKGRRNHNKPSYNLMSFNYNNMLALSLILPYPLANLPILMKLVITNGIIA
jgi:predicted RNase H-like nuclease (RuvC/YqgF family)